MFKYELGAVLKDEITGYIGVVLARTQYTTGCNHYGLQNQKLTSDGKPYDYEWFDETRLVPTGKTTKSNIMSRVKEKGYGSGPEQNAPGM